MQFQYVLYKSPCLTPPHTPFPPLKCPYLLVLIIGYYFPRFRDSCTQVYVCIHGPSARQHSCRQRTLRNQPTNQTKNNLLFFFLLILILFYFSSSFYSLLLFPYTTICFFSLFFFPSSVFISFPSSFRLIYSPFCAKPEDSLCNVTKTIHRK